MIDINLLPDIKKEYIKSQRIKRLFVVGSMLVSVAFLSVTVLLALFVFGAQKLYQSSIQGDIDKAITSLNEIPDLDKAVTIQKQLGALPSLHNEKFKVERLFSYISTITPKDITLSKVLFLTTQDNPTAEINGAGPDPRAINIFVDTIKNATFTQGEGQESIKPFTKVVLESISVDELETTYKITLVYDPIIFDDSIASASLVVPNITTSVSVQERPALFQAPKVEQEE